VSLKSKLKGRWILTTCDRFIGEKYNELADPNLGTATLDNEQFNNDICTTLSLYFFTPPSIMTSMLCYYNNVRHEVYTEFNAREENLIRVPLGVSTFPYDAFPVPKAGAETTTTNLKFFRGECTAAYVGTSVLTSYRERRWGAFCMHGVPKGNGGGYAGVLWTVLPGVRMFRGALPINDVDVVGPMFRETCLPLAIVSAATKGPRRSAPVNGSV
jgi:hypothetical protein